MNDFTQLQLYCLDKVAEGQYTFDLVDRKLLSLLPLEVHSIISAQIGLNKNGDPNGYATFTCITKYNIIVVVWVDFYALKDKTRCGYFTYNGVFYNGK